MRNLVSSLLTGTNELFLVAGVGGILIVLFTPISAGVLDFLLLLNISLALLILLITFYTDKPLEFSTFPSLLLLSTLFRLALNISATRLILNDAHAGQVIGSIGEYVVGGNYIIGLVIFLILIVVQYVVVTNGAQRVAEVAARFILDSLPGKQMSIDADLNMGIITQEQAQKRRSELERESNFYGAMDGASKFVKGDAIAGIIIILIDIIGGLTIGLAQRGMSWGEALQKYTLLTVGDGIVTQIPSLIIAIASGIIITRAATDSRLGVEIVKQFSSHPKILIMAAFAMLCLGAVPGIPILPILCLISILLLLSWMAKRSAFSDVEKEMNSDADTMDEKDEENLYSSMTVEPFELGLGSDLYEHFSQSSKDLEKRISVLRKNLVSELGVVLPKLAIRKNSKLSEKAYEVLIHGDRLADGTLEMDSILAINGSGNKIELEGVKTKEPTYGLPATWISIELRKQAIDLGFTLVEPETVILTHIQEVSRRNASLFMTRNEVEKLVESRRVELGTLLDELIPAQLSFSDVQQVLKNLLDENVPIKNIQTIFDVLADVSRKIKDPVELTDHCRVRLKNNICERLADSEGNIHVLTLSPTLERRFLGTVNPEQGAAPMSPHEFEPVIRKITREAEKLLASNISPVLVCAMPIRRHLKNVLTKVFPQLTILSNMEIGERVNVVSKGVVDLEQLGV